MVIAYWNGMKWECGSKLITYMDGLSTSKGIKTDSNSDKDGKAPTETVGMAEIEVAFTTTYRVETGTRDIKGTIAQWNALIGQAAPLIIGGEIFGPDKLQLQSVGQSNISLRPDGSFNAVTLSFKFKEFKQEVATVKTLSGSAGTKSSKSSKKHITGSGTSSSKNSASALGVGASSSDKKQKKTYADIKAEQTR